MGAPRKPGPSTLNSECTRLKQLGITPTTEQLKKLSLIKDHCKYMQDSPAVKAAIAASGLVITEDQPAKKSLEDILPPLVAYMPKFGNKKVCKQVVYKVELASDQKDQKLQGMQKDKDKVPLTPAIIEVSNNDDLFGDSLLDEEIAESTGIQPSSAIVSSRKGGKKAIFEDYELEAQYSTA